MKNPEMAVLEAIKTDSQSLMALEIIMLHHHFS